MRRTLGKELECVESGLRDVLFAIAHATSQVSKCLNFGQVYGIPEIGTGIQSDCSNKIPRYVQLTLQSASTKETGTSNLLGDKQLVADIEADKLVFSALRDCKAVALASSEENPVDVPMHPDGRFSVAFDPLDGSSIIGANWSVGSIFSIFPGSSFVGRKGSEQCAAAYAVYGPRTVLVIARPVASQHLDPTQSIVQEFTMIDKNLENTGPREIDTESKSSYEWVLTKDNVRIAESKKIFAPANLRASQENKPYQKLVTEVWMEEKYTLRYSGGMVPDIHHIIFKEGGVFCNPSSPSSPAKLRILYEVFPLSFVLESAGGASIVNSNTPALSVACTSHDQRITVCMGSQEEVRRTYDAMDFSSNL